MSYESYRKYMADKLKPEDGYNEETNPGRRHVDKGEESPKRRASDKAEPEPKPKEEPDPKPKKDEPPNSQHWLFKNRGGAKKEKAS